MFAISFQVIKKSHELLDIFVATSQSIEPVEMRKKEFDEFYEDVLYQIALRIMYEVFYSLSPQILDVVVFNGFVRKVDAATG